jgi:hypothetical protein
MDTKNEIQMIHIIQMVSKTPRIPCAHIRGTRDIYKKQVYICISVLPFFSNNNTIMKAKSIYQAAPF